MLPPIVILIERIAMKGHITRKTMIRYLQDDVTARKARAVRQHIENCPACSGTLLILKQMTTPSTDRGIKPGRAVFGKILAYHDSYPLTGKQTAPVPRPRLRFAAAGACAAVFFLFIFGVYSHKRYEHAQIRTAGVRGIVKADTSVLRKGQDVAPGTLITTGDNSKLAIVYGTIMKLIAGPHTKISVTNSHIDRKTGKMYFEMVIDKGSIIAVFDSKRNKLQYTLITPHGKVSSTGSKIAMKVDSSKTRVAVKDGSANISSNHGYSINTEEGSGYSIINNETTSVFDASDDDNADGETLYNRTLRDLADDEDESAIE